MEAIRTKDRIFIALVAPVALAAAYACLWRTECVRRIGDLSREAAALVETDDFPLARANAARLLAGAQGELEAERKTPWPVARVRARAEDAVASRERSVLEVFRQAGLSVGRSCASDAGDASAREALARTGLRPDPVCRQYAVVGGYQQVCAALRAFSARELAVIPDRLEMSAHGRWSFVLWL